MKGGDVGKQSNLLVKKLRKGLPVSEAPLLREVEKERARERAPSSNPHRFKDARTQRLSDLWFSQRTTASVKQKDEVGLAYISLVLGLGEEAAKKFARGDGTTYHQVGLRQGGVEHYTPDLRGFWDRMSNLFPGVYHEEDLAFLISEGGVQATFHLQWQLEIPLAEESPVLRSLSVNAHAYK